MSNKAFGSKELVACLEALGFSPKNNFSKNSSHIKYMPSKDKVLPIGLRPFMMVQLGRKCFDGQDCDRYISEIKKFGYSKKEIEKLL